MRPRRVGIIGGGPAGLMAAEAARHGGCEVDLYDHLGSVGRKILIAGKGGLNLTHSEPLSDFVRRYQAADNRVAEWLAVFGPDELRQWARELGIETRIGSSGRVFPLDLKAAPLLRGWVRRLREQGVRMHMQHRWTGWSGHSACFTRAGDNIEIEADAWVLACGGGSWPVLGADGRWVEILRQSGLHIAPLQAANVGYRCDWSTTLRQRWAGQALKPLAIQLSGEPSSRRQGECVITDYGLEGSLIYALGARLRAAFADATEVMIELDLFPLDSVERLAKKLAPARGKRSLSEHLRRRLGLDGARMALARECLGERLRSADPAELCAALKALPLRLLGAQPIEEAISSAGGVMFDEIDPQLMLKQRPGCFVAGEMIDWDAPTGGYLLTACFASGLLAGRGASAYAQALP